MDSIKPCRSGNIISWPKRRTQECCVDGLATIMYGTMSGNKTDKIFVQHLIESSPKLSWQYLTLSFFDIVIQHPMPQQRHMDHMCWSKGVAKCLRFTMFYISLMRQPNLVLMPGSPGSRFLVWSIWSTCSYIYIYVYTYYFDWNTHGHVNCIPSLVGKPHQIVLHIRMPTSKRATASPGQQHFVYGMAWAPPSNTTGFGNEA